MEDKCARPFKEARIGLALSAGGARGSAHTGVLKVFEQEGIPICAIAGTSIGAMVGGAYAAGVAVSRVEEEWLHTDVLKVVRSFLPAFPRAGLSSGHEKRKILQAILGDRRIEDLPLPFAAVACDIDTGERIVLRSGPLVDAVQASASIPGIFYPVQWQGRLLVDGGLVDPLPVQACRELGADFVIGIDIVPKPRPTAAKSRSVWNKLGQQLHETLAKQDWIPGNLVELLEHLFQERDESHRSLPGLYSVIYQSIVILQQEILQLKLALWPADFLIQPSIPFSDMGYLHGSDGIRAGEQATQLALPQLRARLAQLTRN